MTRPFDSCRLYFHLRSKAYPRHGAEPAEAPAGSGLVDFDHEFDEPNELGLSRRDTLSAMDDLLAVDLVHRLTPDERRRRHLLATTGEPHDLLFVEAVDDLTAVTLLMSSS